MAAQSKELLEEYYDRDYLTYEEVMDLGLRAVTEDGESVLQEFRGKVFRSANRDDASGYFSRSMQEAGQGASPTYLQHA